VVHGVPLDTFTQQKTLRRTLELVLAESQDRDHQAGFGKRVRIREITSELPPREVIRIAIGRKSVYLSRSNDLSPAG
jgi:hypothetical protein